MDDQCHKEDNELSRDDNNSDDHIANNPNNNHNHNNNNDKQKQRPQNQHKQLSTVPNHLKNEPEISQLFQKANKMILNSERFVWDDLFRFSINMQIIWTNFQSMRVMLHYGNYKLKACAIFTEIDQDIFENFLGNQGNFGSVKYIEHERQKYAIKCIPTDPKDSNSDMTHIYKQYFMGCVAAALNVGPAISKIFGYDIVISNNFTLFAMTKCQEINQKRDIQGELLNNLKMLHSIKFIHGDIKPLNTAYDPLLKKHVFIDFGLSVEQKYNQTTKTRFQGTLAFCSQEMRKCYILDQARFVNLFENDYCCLQKTFKRLTKFEQILHHSDANQQWQLQWSTETKHFKSSQLFRSVIKIMRMKYHVENQDLPQILELLQKQKNLKKTFHQLFVLSSDLPKKIVKNQQILKIIEQNRYQLTNNKFNTNQVDQKLSMIFDEACQMRLAYIIMPLSHILQLERREFQNFMENKQWIYKLFLLFDLFTTTNKSFLTLSEFALKKQIITKIYQLKNQQTYFFGHKARFAITYFYDSLKKLNNLNILCSLRTMFISVEDWPHLQQIEDQIITIISDPILKIVKLAQYNLFWETLLYVFEHKRKQKWIQIIKQIQINKQSQNCETVVIFQKIKNLAVNIFNISNNCKSSAELISQIKAQLDEITPIVKQTPYQQSIFNIRYFFYQKNIVSRPVTQQTTLSFQIYTRYFIPFVSDLTNKQILTQFNQIFNPPSINYRKMFVSNPDQNVTRSVIEGQFALFCGHEQFLGAMLWERIKIGCIHKRIIGYLINKINNISVNNQSQFAMQKIISKLLFIRSAFYLIDYNYQYATFEQKLTNSEAKQILQDLQKMFNEIVKYQFVQNKIKNYKQLQALVLMLRICIDFTRGCLIDDLEDQLRELVGLFQNLLNSRPNFIEYLFTVFNFLRFKINQRQPHFCQDLILKIEDLSMKSVNFVPFQIEQIMLTNIITIKNNRNQHQQSLQFLFRYIEILNQKNAIRQRPSFYIYLIHTIKAFLKSSELYLVKQFYEQLCLKPYKNRPGLYQYLLFRMFLEVIQFQSWEHIITTIKQTGLMLVKMPFKVHQPMKQYLFQVCRQLQLYKNARKHFICARLQISVKINKRYTPILKKFQSKFKKLTSLIIIPQSIQKKLFSKLYRACEVYQKKPAQCQQISVRSSLMPHIPEPRNFRLVSDGLENQTNGIIY